MADNVILLPFAAGVYRISAKSQAW